MTLLKVAHLRIKDTWSDETLVDNVNFTVQCGETLGIIGESGSGKSITCKALIGLNAQRLSVSGDIFLNIKICYAIRISFNKVGKQMIETLRAHTTLSKQQIKQELIHYMTYMKLKDPRSLLKAYPYMLSGGMLQRMMIALALALKPKLIIADEPTTALDTITQYEVINSFKDIKQHFDCAMIFISHDLTVINKIADRVVVMKEGRVIEEGRTNMVLQQPRHHYTAYLLSTKKTIHDYFQLVLRGDFNA